MYCPFCNADDTKVVDSRLVADGGQVRRRRECVDCSERFTTYELAELVMPSRTFPWKIIAQWYPLEQPLENRGRRFENRRKNIGVETGKCACGATATLQHIITECRPVDS